MGESGKRLRTQRILLRASLFLVLLRRILRRFVERALRIVLRSRGLPVFVQRAIALVADVENFAQINVRPHLSPLRHQIAVERLAVLDFRWPLADPRL